jgi:hypothetical protein
MRFGGYRVALGLLPLIALTVQFIHLARLGVLNPVNFFSYFTNLSNIVGGLVFVYSGLRSRASVVVDLLRGAATVYLATTGVVYNLLLTGQDLGALLPWVNFVIHLVMPLAAVIDWLTRPPEHLLSLRQTWVWLVFPLAYLGYSLVRGAATGWYPYPFLNPANVGGPGGVAAYCVGIAAAMAALVYGTTWIGNRQHRHTR